VSPEAALAGAAVPPVTGNALTARRAAGTRAPWSRARRCEGW
jgi:hypothetical protein